MKYALIVHTKTSELGKNLDTGEDFLENLPLWM